MFLYEITNKLRKEHKMYDGSNENDQNMQNT